MSPARSGYLLDTNIVSETRRRRPDPGVIEFLSSTDSADLFVSVLTLGEMRKGVAIKQMHDAGAADSIEAWVESIEQHFADHVIGIDVGIARIWGELSAQRTLPVIDALLAATALRHRWTLVTRNTRDMVATGVALLNPFRNES